MTDAMTNQTEQIKIVLLDDHPLFRRGLAELINDSAGMQVQAEFDQGTSLLEYLQHHSADLLLLDLQMPDMSGLQVLKTIRQLNQTLKIIIMTACTEEEKLLEAMRLGTNGFLQKDTLPDELIRQIKAVYQGQFVLNPASLTRIAEHFRADNLAPQPVMPAEITPVKPTHLLDELTEREKQTLGYIAQGLNNKLIARQLGISDGTVKVYVKSLLRKLKLHSRLELAAWAHKHNIEETNLNAG